MGDAKIAELEKRIKELELEVSKKDEIIAKLSGGSSGAGSASAPSGAPAAPPQPPAPSDEYKELLCYDDDAAIGKDAPSLESLKFHNGDAITYGSKPVVITWFCNLNKSDFVTLSVLSDIYEKYKGQAEFLAISRDHEEKDTEKWLTKYQGKFMAEQKNVDGSAGVTAKCSFQMAFDPEHKVNAGFKTAMGKSVVGVGLVILIDKTGKIAFHETFIRGKGAGQLEYQLHACVTGADLLKNGPAPEQVEEEIEGEAGTVPDDIDDFLGGGGDY